MGKILEAKAVISAEDRTGSTFDKIARKFEGVAKTAQTLDKIRPLNRTFEGLSKGSMLSDWGQKFQHDIDALKLSTKQLAGVQKDWDRFGTAMKGAGPIKADHYLRAIGDWKSTTLSNLREVKAGLDDSEKHHRRFFKSAGALGTGAGRFASGAGSFALGAAGIGGGAYLATKAIHAGGKQVADRGREMARYSLGGMNDTEKEEASAKAGEISAKYPSISRTEVLGHIRQLRGRLGDFHHAMDNVETISKAQVVLGTLGNGGEHASEDLEKLVLGLESQGLGNNPAKFKQYTNAFVRAKSLFPDLRGADFQQFMQRANASKYGLSDDYLQNVVPTMMQHEGASNFGTMQASAFSALIGKRQTNAAKLNMRGYGLLDEKDNLKNEKAFIANPRQWSEDNLVPALAKKNISTDEEHRGDVVKALTQMFSNRKVGEFFASMIVNRSIIDKDASLLKNAKGTEGAETSRREDPYVAVAGLTTQLKDTAAAFIGIKPVVEAMNNAATSLGNMAKFFETGKVPEGTNLDKINKATAEARQAPRDWNEAHRRDNLVMEEREIDQKLPRIEAGGKPSEDLLKKLRLRRFELRSGIDASKSFDTMPSIYSDAERDRWEEMDREHRRGAALTTMPSRSNVPLPMRDPRKSLPDIPMPTSDPRRAEGGGSPISLPPVQTMEGANVMATLTGSGEVTGEVKVNVTVEAGSSLLAIEQSVKSLLARVSGVFNAGGGNGPGSVGKSSPDAAAPNVGAPSGGHH